MDQSEVAFDKHDLGAGETVIVLTPALTSVVRTAVPGAKIPEPSSDEDSIAMLRHQGADARVAVVLGSDPFTAEMIAALPKLELIVAVSVGIDGVDMNAVRARGIKVTNAGDANCSEVADFALALALAVRRNVVTGHNSVLSGDWETKGRPPVSPSFSGGKIGIVGLGNIGREIAKRCAGFDCEMRWWGPREKPGEPLPRMESVAALAAWADTLFIACPGGDATYRLIDRAFIDAVGPSGILVNVARGSVVHEDELIAALKDGRLGGAGVDVFEHEPTPHARWQSVPNVVLAPHQAGASANSIKRALAVMQDNLHRFLTGKALLNRMD